MTRFRMIKTAVPAAFALLGLAGLARGLLALGETIRPGPDGDILDDRGISLAHRHAARSSRPARVNPG